MDSVAIQADVELGGTDQKFNLLVGRDIQREYSLAPQVIITMPMLAGTDGVEKMSKSLNNYIGLNESPKQIYGKTLSIPDRLINDYFVLTTNVSEREIEQIKQALEDPRVNPRDIKRRLARELVGLYHSEEAAIGAEKEFDRIFVKKDLPDEIPEVSIDLENSGISIVKLLTDTKMVTSNNEARRMIDQGGVSVDGEKISNQNAQIGIEKSVVVKVGKRKFLRVSKAHQNQ
jgi:tyrosyl-tRNA synthetase